MARFEYVNFARKKRSSNSGRRRVHEKLLRYVERNLKIIEKLNEKVSFEVLSQHLYKSLLVSSEIFRQQQIMFKSNVKRIDDRIVNVTQPHIRPIKRGKDHIPR